MKILIILISMFSLNAFAGSCKEEAKQAALKRHDYPGSTVVSVKSVFMKNDNGSEELLEVLAVEISDEVDGATYLINVTNCDKVSDSIDLGYLY